MYEKYILFKGNIHKVRTPCYLHYNTQMSQVMELKPMTYKYTNLNHIGDACPL